MSVKFNLHYINQTLKKKTMITNKRRNIASFIKTIYPFHTTIMALHTSAFPIHQVVFYPEKQKISSTFSLHLSYDADATLPLTITVNCTSLRDGNCAHSHGRIDSCDTNIHSLVTRRSIIPRCLSYAIIAARYKFDIYVSLGLTRYATRSIRLAPISRVYILYICADSRLFHC